MSAHALDRLRQLVRETLGDLLARPEGDWEPWREEIAGFEGAGAARVPRLHAVITS